MAIAPTRVLYTTPTIGWNSTATPKTTPTFNVQSGDLIVVMAAAPNAATISTPTSTGNVTWTSRVNSGTLTGYGRVTIWTGAVNATGTGITVSVAATGGLTYGFSATVFRNHGGVGAASSTTSASITPAWQAFDSAKLTILADGAALAGTSRVWYAQDRGSTQIVEDTYAQNTGYTVYEGHVLDGGAETASPANIGLSTSPSGAKFYIGAIEVKGPGGWDATGSGTLSLSGTPGMPAIPAAVTLDSQSVDWTTAASTKTTSAFDVRAGETLVVFATAPNGTTVATPSATGGSITWTLRASYTSITYDYGYVWTGDIGADAKGVAVSATASSGAAAWGFRLERWRSVGTFNNAATRTTTSTAAGTITDPGSGTLTWHFTDANAVDTPTRTLSSGNNETLYQYSAGVATLYGGTVTPPLKQTAVTYGYSGPAGTYKLTGAAVAFNPSSGPLAMDGGEGTLSASGSVGFTATETSTGSGALAVSGSPGPTGSVAASGEGTLSLGDVRIGFTDVTGLNSVALWSDGNLGFTPLVGFTEAPARYTLFTPADVPAVFANDGMPIVLATKFFPDRGSVLTGIRFYKPEGATGTHTGVVYAWNGSVWAWRGSATTANETASGWQEITLSTPVQLNANQPTMVTWHSPSGHYSATGGYFNTQHDSGILHGYATSAIDGGNGLFVYSDDPGAFPTGTYNGGNYWVEPVVLTEWSGAGDGTFSTAGVLGGSGAVGFSGDGSLTLDGSAYIPVGNDSYSDSLALSGSGTLTTDVWVTAFGSRPLGGTGQLALSARVGLSADNARASEGWLSLAGKARFYGAYSGSGEGLLDAAGTPRLRALQAFAATGGLDLLTVPALAGAIATAGEGRLNVFPSFSGSGQLRIYGFTYRRNATAAGSLIPTRWAGVAVDVARHQASLREQHWKGTTS